MGQGYSEMSLEGFLEEVMCKLECLMCLCVRKEPMLGTCRLGLGEPTSDTLHLHTEGERLNRRPVDDAADDVCLQLPGRP